MKRLIWLPVAGFLLVAGAAVAAAAPTVEQVSRTVGSAFSDSEGGAGEIRFGPGELLEGVLSDLVEAGTISPDQSDAIVAALQEKIEAHRAATDQQRELFLAFAEDGTISQDEIDQLPEDSPLRELWNSIAQDGEVRLDQLRELGPGFRHGPGPGHGFFIPVGPDAPAD